MCDYIDVGEFGPTQQSIVGSSLNRCLLFAYGSILRKLYVSPLSKGLTYKLQQTYKLQ